MTDFINAFNDGQGKAEQSEKNTTEIGATIEQLSEQLNAETEGKLRFEIQRAYESPNIFSGNILSGRYYRAIFAVNPIAGEKQELAEFSTAEDGYPCTLSWRSLKYSCTEKSELETALAAMLCDTRNAKAIRGVINAVAKPAEPNEEEAGD